MSLLRHMKKRTLGIYQMILTSFVLTVFIIVLVLSVSLYTQFERESLVSIQSLTNKNMEKIMQGTDFISSTGKNLTLQVFKDMNVSKLLYGYSTSIPDINYAIKQLEYYRQITPYIDSICVYNAKSGDVYVSSSYTANTLQNKDSFYDKGIISLIENSGTYAQLSPIPRQIICGKSGNRNIVRNVFSFVYLGTPLWKQKPDCAVIVNISADWVNELTDNMNDNSDSSDTFLIDKEGKVVSFSRKYPMMSDISSQGFVKDIMNLQQESGFVKEIIGETEMLVSYSRSKENGWILVQLTPYATTIKGLKSLRTDTVVKAFLILVAGILTTFLLSRKIYTPIEGILSKLKKLEAEKINSIYNLKQEFLRNVLLESKTQDAEAIKIQLANFNIRLDIESQMISSLFIIDRYHDFCDKYDMKDRKTFKFAIMNIANELFEKNHINMESVDMGDDKIALILNPEGGKTKGAMELIEKCICNISSSVSAYLKISITAVMSAQGQDLYNLNAVYNNLLEVSFQRMVYGYGSIIHAETVNELKYKVYKYSYKKEKLLLNSIMLDNMDEAKKLYTEIIDEIKGYSYITIQFVLSRLIFSINMAVETIKKNSFIESDLDVNINHLFFSNAETLDEIGNRIFSIFDRISANIKRKKNISYDRIVTKIIEIINAEYMNPNISISYIADKMNLSQTYVGRMFKKQTFKSIVEYIMDTRLKIANELLTNTNHNIEEIASATGFSSSIYFHTSYKKAYGVTPGEHRLKTKVPTRIESNHG